MKGIGLRTAVIIIVVLLIGMVWKEPSSAFGASGQSVFYTWEGFEVDKCASIWLISRFVDQDAAIKIIPREEMLPEGIPFDIPDARFRRYHNMSTFDSILRHYNFQDPRLKYLARIINDIELNIWEKKVCPETGAVQSAVNAIILDAKSNNTVIEKSRAYFDSLYEQLPF